MKERLQYIINNEGVTNLRFAEMLGVNPASISHILSERNKPSFDFVVKIAEKLPHYNLRWLLTGCGEPLETPQITQTLEPSQAELFNTEPTKQRSQEEQQPTESATTKEEPHLAAPEENTTNTQQTTTSRLIVCFPDGTFSEYTPKI